MLADLRAQTPVDDLQSLLAQARSAMTTKRVADAITLYRRAASVSATDVKSRRELARLLALDPETQGEALKMYKEATALTPRDAALLLEYAAMLVATGDNLNAVIEYRHVFGLSPEDGFAVREYVRQVARLGATPVTIKNQSESVAKAPKNLAARLILAGLLESDGHFGDALDQYWLAYRLAPNNEVAIRGIAETWLGSGYYENADQFFAILTTYDEPEIRGAGVAGQARVLMATEQPEAALKFFLTHRAVVRKSSTALVVLADCYRALRQAVRERASLEQALTLNPREVVPVLERLARVTYEIGDKSASQSYCARLLALDMRSGVGLQGAMLNGQTAPPSWLADEKGMNATRRSGRKREAGEAAMFWGQPEKAIPLLRGALETLKDSPRLLLNLGDTLIQTKDYDGASAAYSRITDRRHLRSLLHLAHVELLRNQVARSLDIYRYALDLDANNLQSLRGYAEALRHSGDLKQSALLLRRLTLRAPESRTIAKQYGEVLSALGRSYRSRSPNDLTLTSINHASVIMHSSDSTKLEALIEPVIEIGDKVKLKITNKVKLKITNLSDFNTEYQLDEAGFVRLPFIKEPINARCLTERELSDQIIKQGGERLKHSAAEITITEYQRAALIVAGAVYLPGSFHVRGTLNLRESLMLASGATMSAGRNVYVLRGAGSCGNIAQRGNKMNVDTFERTAVESEQVKLPQPLGSGDIVFVPEENSAFIVGAVNNPGIVSTRDGLALQEALKQVGGTQTGAQLDRVRLLRLLPDGVSRQSLDIDLNLIREHRVGEVILRMGDIVVVQQSGLESPMNSFAALLRQTVFRASPPSHDPPQRITHR